MKKYLLFGFLALVFTQVSWVSDTQAGGYKVTPRVIDREVDQRDIFTETITLENYASHVVTVFPSVNEVRVDEGGDITDFIPPSMIDDKTGAVTSWITISRATQELQPGEVRDLPINFAIHKDAPAGDYRAFIGFGSGRNRIEAEETVKNGQAPGVIVTLSVEKDQTEFLKLGGFVVDRFIIDSENDAVTYTLANPGESPITPTGEIIISNPRGKEVGAITVNPNGDTLAPGQTTEFVKQLPIDGYLGKYKAFLTVDYGTDQLASVYDTTFFYVFPWQQLLILLMVVMAAAVFVTVWLHRRMHPVQHREETGHLPVHIYDGVSDDQDHDINLKK